MTQTRFSLLQLHPAHVLVVVVLLPLEYPTLPFHPEPSYGADKHRPDTVSRRDVTLSSPGQGVVRSLCAKVRCGSGGDGPYGPLHVRVIVAQQWQSNYAARWATGQGQGSASHQVGRHHSHLRLLRPQLGLREQPVRVPRLPLASRRTATVALPHRHQHVRGTTQVLPQPRIGGLSAELERGRRGAGERSLRQLPPDLHHPVHRLGV